MLFRINFMFIMFKDYFISTKPFMDTPLTVSQISIIFTYMITH
jgi:hypothetical protein